MSFVEKALSDAHNTLQKTLSDKNFISQLENAVSALAEALHNNKAVMSCGNGGSMCDAIHFAEELTGRYRKDRRPIRAFPMGDPGHLTCVSNDFGYDHVFSRLVEAWGQKGDFLLAISTSGNSQNVIKAVQVAQSLGMKSIGLLGKGGGKLKEMVDYPIVVPSDITDRIQEVHIKAIHIMIEGVERKLFPDHYA